VGRKELACEVGKECVGEGVLTSSGTMSGSYQLVLTYL
jgi:hypothetical protein